MKTSVGKTPEKGILRKTQEGQPQFIFFSGLLFLPAFFLQTSLMVRLIQVLFIISVYVWSGKRFRLLTSAFVFCGIVFANVLRPAGEVIISIGFILITKDALFGGVSKALLLIGLVYLSRLMVSSKLVLPGKLGSVMGSVFLYFEKITEMNKPDILKSGAETGTRSGTRSRTRRSIFGTFTNYLDTILFYSDGLGEVEKSNPGDKRENKTAKGASPPTGYLPVVLLLFLFINYTLLILDFLKYL